MESSSTAAATKARTISRWLVRRYTGPFDEPVHRDRLFQLGITAGIFTAVLVGVVKLVAGDFGAVWLGITRVIATVFAVAYCFGLVAGTIRAFVRGLRGDPKT